MLSPFSPLSPRREPTMPAASSTERSDASVASLAPSRRVPKRSTTHPVPLEPLSFAKVPLSPAASAGASTSVFTSTDSECFSDTPDAAGGPASATALSRSPSLLTSLIMNQSRISAMSTSRVCSPVTPTTPGGLASAFAFADSPRPGPILRQSSRASSFSEADPGPVAGPSRPPSAATSVNPKPNPDDSAPPPLRHRRSCLKFAVTPRPALAPRATSPRRLLDSPAPSRHGSRSDSVAGSHVVLADEAVNEENEDEDEENEDDDEDDEDDDEAQVKTPGWCSDESSDAGYREDSEDGFTSDEGDLSLAASPRWRPYLAARWTLAPILSTPRRRAALPDVAVTTDDGEPAIPRSRVRVRIRDENDKYTRKPTRHLSPPPAELLRDRSRSRTDRRPPAAARSPSAAELCRRRSGVARSSPSPSEATPRLRGWKSDDGRALLGARTSEVLALGRALCASPEPEAAAAVEVEVEADADSTAPSVKFVNHERELRALREARDKDRRAARRRASVAPPTSGPALPFRLARRGSAPAAPAAAPAAARIDEVHVLTSAGAGACPRRGLKHVLRAARVYYI